MKDKNYNKTKKRNKLIRWFLPNPFKPLREFGMVGTVAGMTYKKIIKKPVHSMSRFFTGLFYEKGIDSPSTGSNIYNIVYIVILIAIGFSTLLLVKNYENIFMYITNLLR